MIFGLVGCVKTKADKPMPASKLYLSSLFKGSFNYAKRNCDHVYILSAFYGLVHEDKIIRPYDSTLSKFTAIERIKWSSKVLIDILAIIKNDDHIMFLCGGSYRQYLSKWLCKRGFTISCPVKGLAFGQQLAFYKRENQNGS